MTGPQYTLYYHAFLPGRGEFIRLVLEAAGAAYTDVAKSSADPSASQAEVMSALSAAPQHFAPPFLNVSEDGVATLTMSQTPVCTGYVADRHGLTPASPQLALSAKQLELTIMDLAAEAHNTHHPDPTKFFEEQKEEAKAASAAFIKSRLPKFMSYLSTAISQWQKESGGGPFVFGESLSLADTALFQTVRGLQYAFPKGWAALPAEQTKVLDDIAEAVEKHPKIAAYLASDRRMNYNENGLFRKYPELDIV